MPQINLEDNEYAYVMGLLWERPFKEVHQLIGKLITQQQGAQKMADLAAMRVGTSPRPDGQGIPASGH